jgi:5'-3' exoribonuclease 2
MAQELPSPPVKKSKVTTEAVVDDSKYKAELKEILKSKTDQFDSMVSGEEVVRLGEQGWKQRYYEQKFGISDPEDQAQLIADLKRSYVEGLCWVMRYYFDGVASWRWFYPFHYAPFASDLTGIADMKVRTSHYVACFSQIEQGRVGRRPDTSK